MVSPGGSSGWSGSHQLRSLSPMNHDDDTRKPYEAPSITEQGSVADLTNANKYVTLLDMTLGAGQQAVGS